MEFTASAELLMFLFAIAVVAGLLDTLAGGGGLVTIPALIVCGVPPLAALGTNKLQGSVGTATATLLLIRKKKISFQENKPLMISAFVGSVLGTVAVQFIDTKILSFVIPAVLLLIAVYFLVAPKAKAQARVSDRNYRLKLVPSIGFYDGMFGPGTGSFFALAGVSCRGLDLIAATASAKPLNFATNLASLIVFLFAGQVVWVVGILMMVGQVFGAWVGAHVLFKINPSYLRAVVVTMCLGMLVKYCHSMGWLSLS